MTRQLRLLLVLLAFIIAALLLTAAPAAQADPGVVSFLFGRAVLYDVNPDSCQRVADSASIWDAADYLQQRGYAGVVEPSVGFTAEHSPTCIATAAYASWDDLQRLRQQYGWQAVSAGTGREDITTLTDAQIRAESCGTLPDFQDHGFSRAWGMFAYPGNQWDDHAQAIVDDCYAFGRTYRGKWNQLVNPRSFLYLDSPWFARVNSVQGGQCNDPDLSCYRIAGMKNDRRYDSVPLMSSYVRQGADTWAGVQVYRLRVGSGAWGDCTGAWQSHWTRTAEDYCLADWEQIVDAVPPTEVVADPAYVAQREGRTP